MPKQDPQKAMNPQAIREAFASQSQSLSSEAERLVREAIQALDQGQIRVCEKKGSKWQVNDWVKEAILLYFKIEKMRLFEAGDFRFFDKIPLKKWSGREGVRAVPQALVRQGAYVGRRTVLMPSYVNIGAYVDEGSMIDTWATVGSCAQVGKNVHVSGGAGIGGVLEPVQARPVVIEDDVFIGSRAIVVEGVLVRRGAVIGAGAVLTASSKIIDVSQAPAKEYRREIPENSVVIPGSRRKLFPGGFYHVPCAMIIGKRSEKTDKKTALNEALRAFAIPV